MNTVSACQGETRHVAYAQYLQSSQSKDKTLRDNASL